MGREPLRPCRYRRCPNVVRGGGYCPQHKAYEQKQNKINSQFRLKKKKVNPFYGSKAWKIKRDKYIANNPTCKSCGAVGREVDHIVPLNQGGDKFDDSNLQTLCRSCHAKKTWQENQSILHDS